MSEQKSSLRYWVVTCLGCKSPIPLFAEPVDPDSSTPAAEAKPERSFFRAWCVECGREYPYLAEAMIAMDEPPRDKSHRQIEFSRFRQRLQAKRAHA